MTCPDCGGSTFWSEDAQDWLHEASDSTCFLNTQPKGKTMDGYEAREKRRKASEVRPLNGFEQWKAEESERARRGEIELVAVEDLEPGDILDDFDREFSHLQDGQNDQTVLVKFTDGLGYVESRGAKVAVTR